MKDQSTSNGAKDKRSTVQQVRVLDVNGRYFENNWTHTPSASGSYGRLAGWQARNAGKSRNL